MAASSPSAKYGEYAHASPVADSDLIHLLSALNVLSVKSSRLLNLPKTLVGDLFNFCRDRQENLLDILERGNELQEGSEKLIASLSWDRVALRRIVDEKGTNSQQRRNAS